MKVDAVLLTVVFAGSFASMARAQSVAGFNADRFNPSERGSEWFVLDSLDLRGDLRPAAGVVGEWAKGVFRLRNPDGSIGSTVVDQQTFLHAGGSLVLGNWLRLSVNLPINVEYKGYTVIRSDGETFYPPSNPGLGDARIGADFRILGTYGSPLSLSAGAQYFLPTGQVTDYTGDNLSHGILRVQAAGEIGKFVYAANLGYHIRGVQTVVDGASFGSAIVFGAAAGARLLERRLLVGPEVYGEVSTASGSFFANYSTPVEALLGAHYTWKDAFRFGAAVGPGITHDLGSPIVRVVLSAEWTPGYQSATAMPTPAATDKDHER